MTLIFIPSALSRLQTCLKVVHSVATEGRAHQWYTDLKSLLQQLQCSNVSV